MQILEFELNGQKLKKENGFPDVVASSNKYLKMVVNGIPDGYLATAYFSLSWVPTQIYNLSLANGEGIIDEFLTTIPENPSEYFDYIVSVSVVAVNSEGTRITTNMVDILLDKSNYSPETTNTPEIPQSQYDQFVSDIAVQIEGVADAIKDIQKDIVKVYRSQVEDWPTEHLIARFKSPILAGDEVTVSATYTGENDTTFDYRVYDADGQIYIIKTQIPFGEEYTFVADRDYAESSFYVGLSAAETGKVLDCKVYVPGELMLDVAHLEKVTEKLDEDVSNLSTMVTNIEGNNIDLYSKPLSALTVGRVYQGVFQPTITTMKCTDYIAVKPGKKYLVYGGFFSSADFFPAFDADKQYIGPVSCSKTITTYPYDRDKNYVEFTAGPDTYYIRTNFFADTDLSGKGFYMFCADDLSAFGATKVLVMGDSISTDYYGSYKKWVTNLIDDNYFTKVNTENDSIHATGFVATYNGDDDFVTRLKAKTNTDEYGAVIVFGGVNDYLKSVPFDTFTAAVDEYFDYLVTNFVGARLCVLLPLMTANGKNANAAGKTLHDYVDYINSVCDTYCLPRLNLTDRSGFAPFIDAFKARWTLVPAGYTEPDGVHPTEQYEKSHLTPMVKNFLDGLL